MKKLFAVLVLLGVSVLAACSEVKAFDLETETQLVVGLEAAYAPFNWMVTTEQEGSYPLHGTPNHVMGYDVDIAVEIAQTLGLELVIKAIEWDGLILALQTGEIDLIIAGMSPTEERKLQIDFTNEYYRSEIVMVVKANSSFATATQLSDFDGARIVAQQGTLYDDLITNQMPNSTHNNPLGTYGELTISITSNVADAFIAELPVAMSVTSTNTDLSIVRLTDGGFDMDEADIVVSIGTRKVDTELTNAINEALSQISQARRNELMLQAITRSNA